MSTAGRSGSDVQLMFESSSCEYPTSLVRLSKSALNPLQNTLQNSDRLSEICE
jgi:hypothetical protein